HGKRQRSRDCQANCLGFLAARERDLRPIGLSSVGCSCGDLVRRGVQVENLRLAKKSGLSGPSALAPSRGMPIPERLPNAQGIRFSYSQSFDLNFKLHRLEVS